LAPHADNVYVRVIGWRELREEAVERLLERIPAHLLPRR
jgi:hypothetical protein